jgi:hypothetical protein
VITGADLEIANVIAIPSRWTDAGIFGADFVSARPGHAVIAADLSPLSGNAGTTHPDTPDWARSVFSSTPLIRRVTRDDVDDALREAAVLMHGFIERATHQQAWSGSFALAAAIERYMRAHRSDTRTLTMLDHMFGAEWSHRFVEAVLYPSRPGTHAQS